MAIVLLDTHAFVWFVTDDDRLSHVSRRILELRSTVALVSVVTFWELATKHSKGKIRLDQSLDDLMSHELVLNGFELLNLEPKHLVTLDALPYPQNGHRDPMDRTLVAQAICEEIDIVSADPALDAYAVRRIW